MKSEGICKFCKKTFSGRTMTRHLQSCAEKSKMQTSENEQEKIFLIKAGAGPFWVYFEVNASSTLNTIDRFLRKLWLECCGHLSAFTIREISYSSYPNSELRDRSMNVPLKNLLKPNLEFTHEYDFGTTTELNLKCISKRYGEAKDEINILARNDLPEFNCVKCEKPAKEICSECIWNGEESLLCESCAKNHECEEEMFLPVVNPPRMGMCGYTGDD